MTHKSYDEILREYNKYATTEDMEEVSKLTSEYVDHPYDKHEFLRKIKAVLMPFLCQEDARHYVSEMHNMDGTHGEHWTYEQVKSVATRHGIPMMSDMFSEWDMYAAANMMWSDLYDPNKPVEMYIKDAHSFLSDPDFPRPGKMKWYLTAKARLE